MKEVSWITPIEKAEFIFKREVMIMEHNYLCAVCKEKSGVMEIHIGILQPCWDCQKKWRLKKVNFIDRWFRRK